MWGLNQCLQLFLQQYVLYNITAVTTLASASVLATKIWDERQQALP